MQPRWEVSLYSRSRQNCCLPKAIEYSLERMLLVLYSLVSCTGTWRVCVRRLMARVHSLTRSAKRRYSSDQANKVNSSTAILSRCRCVLSSCEAFVWEITALTSMSVWGRMLTFAWTLSRDIVQKENRYGFQIWHKVSQQFCVISNFLHAYCCTNTIIQTYSVQKSTFWIVLNFLLVMSAPEESSAPWGIARELWSQSRKIK
jgi:hypothetical protein